ncbi:MAG: lipopolysaccharide biosynthesis protein [Actinobacteria bacterium]|nr:lipopolysaccharide biosynthesis protein [Actinomycetota bacterium]
MSARPSPSALLRKLRTPGASEQIWAMALETGNIVGTMLAFLLLGRSLGVDGYGGYVSLYAVISPLVTLSSSGVVMALLQHAVARDEPIAETARSSLSIVLLFGGVLSVGASAFAFFVVGGLGPVAIVSIVLIELVTTPVLLVGATVIQAETSFEGAAKVRLLLVAGRSVMLVALFLAGALTVANLGIAQLTWSALLGLVTLQNVGRRYGFSLVPGRIHPSHVRTNLVFSAAISADAVGNDGDKVVLASYKYTEDTGLYGAAYRIVQLGMVPLGALANTTHVRFLARSDEPRHYLKLAVRYSGIAALYGIVFAIGVVIAAPIFPLVMGSSFEGSVEMARWLSPIVLLRGLGMYSLNALLGLGRTGLRTTIVVANAAFGVTLYLILIPGRGWHGALIGTLITEVLQVVMTWTALLYCQRQRDRDLARSVVVETDPDRAEDAPEPAR